jgi:hypothetical protein
MRGAKVFSETVRNTDQSPPTRRGRSEPLQRMRDRCLLARYYYYSQLKGRFLDDVLYLLTSEFFLSKERILRLVKENAEVVRTLREQKIKISHLQHAWPQYKW